MTEHELHLAELLLDKLIKESIGDPNDPNGYEYHAAMAARQAVYRKQRTPNP